MNTSVSKISYNKLNPMKTGNQTFMLEKLAKDCEPLQYIRELTVNSIQAIQERSKSVESEYLGQIIWDVDWNMLDSIGVYKLQISDNGTGMTPGHMDERIRNLASSGRIQSHNENFGLGAKITAGVLNPNGMWYNSWVNDQGYGVLFHKDLDLNEYGLKRWESEDGIYESFLPLNNDIKPEPIDTCGTSVTLMGNSQDDTTILPPQSDLKWLVYYLNNRFFEIPNNITIKVRVFNKINKEEWPDNKQDTSASQFRVVKSMKERLNEHSVSSGVKDFDTVKIHWFILPENGISQKDIWDSRAHSAALYQGELYEARRGKQALSRIRDFGIIYGTDRVIIYAEPKQSMVDIYPDTSRSSLKVNGMDIPWDKWTAEFRQNMPEEIKDMMDGISSKAAGKDHRQAIKDRLREIEHLTRVSRYKRDLSGNLSVEGHLPGGLLRKSALSRNSTGSGGGSGGGRGIDVYAAYLKQGGENAIETPYYNNIPDLKWVSVKNKTRFQGDELEDRAGMYLEPENTIFINEDFRVFIDLINYLIEQHHHVDAVEIKDVAEEWIGQQLAEVVLGLQSLKGSYAWNTDQLKQAMSPESLTAAVMPRLTVIRSMNRAISARRGAIRISDAVETSES